MKSFDYEQFEKNFLDATRQVVQRLINKKEAQAICAFALYSDESGSSISASTNICKCLAKMRKEDPDEYLYYRWSPAEWKYDGIENEGLDQLSDQLSSISMELDEHSFEEYVPEIFRRCFKCTFDFEIRRIVQRISRKIYSTI